VTAVDERERTGVFRLGEADAMGVQDILTLVYRALEERGYDAVDQIVGYLVSGDPTYVTSHADARKLIRQVDRLQLLEELVRAYVETHMRARTS
jgi:uncharacterized protein (UPF0297 family)